MSSLPHRKYPAYLSMEEERDTAQLKPTPSQIITEMSLRHPSKNGKIPAPEIIHFSKEPLVPPSSLPADQPLFQPSPLHMQFRGYTEFGTHKQQLYFRNNDSVPRRLRVKHLDSPHFSIREIQKKENRVAGGMEVCYEVTFTPHEKRDYHEQLVCVTDREEFIVELSALGPWSCVDFPDEIGFGECPVNYTNERTFLIRNIGEQDTKFVLNTCEPFSFVPSSAFIKVGDTMQVTCQFSPKRCGNHQGEMRVTYENGQTSYTRIHGSCDDLNVSIDKPVAEVESAFISLTSSCSVMISNDSDVPIKFSWKSFAVAMDDARERERLHDEIDRMEHMEYRELNISRKEEEQNYSSEEEEADGSPRRMDLIIIKQKYKNLRRAINEDQCLFADDTFKVEPVYGEIWSHASREIIITFSPLVASSYECIASLEVTGRQNRLPLKMIGNGIGPKAAFSFPAINVGQVFIGSKQTYETHLENRGDIPLEYALQESVTLLAKSVQFSPSTGTVPVEASTLLQVIFNPQDLGDFSEEFIFMMKGSNDKIRIRFSGKVIGPTFHTNIEQLKFGRVAYGFENKMKFQLFNTSLIPMEYILRVPGDGKFDEPEFVLDYPAGIITAGKHQDLEITFTSRTLIKYNMKMVVDVVGISAELMEIPIRAECAVAAVNAMSSGKFRETMGDNDLMPDDEFQTPEEKEGEINLLFGKCFIRHSYSMPLQLRNTSDIRAKFEIQTQDESSEGFGAYSVSQYNGVIEPLSELPLIVHLKAGKLGKISIPVIVRVLGSDKPPILINLVAYGCGPRVTMECATLDFGKIQCLESASNYVTLRNQSLIEAPFSSFLQSSKSRFNIDCFEGIIPPGESLDIRISICADDTIVHKDEIHVAVAEGMRLILPVRAVGLGTTVFCKNMKDLQYLGFENVFTSTVNEKKFLLENKGTRDQLLVWSNKSQLELVNAQNIALATQQKMLKDKDKAVQKKAAKMEIPQIPEAAFSVYPESVLLKPHMGCMFTIKAERSIPGSIIENFSLQSKVGKEKKPITVTEAKFEANFTNPLLHGSDELLEFCYTCSPDDPVVDIHSVQKRPFQLTNISKLPLNFILRTHEPFSVDTWEISLQPGETANITVLFDPFVKDTLKCQTITGKLTAIHQDHPQKDVFELRAQINYPNLDFQDSSVEFGCILDDTSKVKTMQMTNNSIVDVRYSWVFAENEVDSMSPGKMFDIRPLRGILRPGESQGVEVCLFGGSSSKYKAIAICDVLGGPSYEIPLLAETSNITYKVDTDSFDFGEMIHDKTEEKEFTISNTGKVPFEFRTSFNSKVVKCIPAEGRIMAKDTATIKVFFSPVVPELVVEDIHLEVAHYEPTTIQVVGKGIFANVCLNLQRDADEQWLSYLDAAASFQRGVPDLTGQPVIGGTGLMECKVSVAESRRSKMSKGSMMKFDMMKLPAESEANRLKFVDFLKNPVVNDSIFALSTYVVDFGNVIVGKSRKKTFQLMNTSTVPLSLSVDRQSNGNHISVEPLKVNKLPEGESIEFALQLNASKDVMLGPLNQKLLLDIRYGPPVLVLLKANITVPDVGFVKDSVDFGSVLVGQEKISVVQVQNTSPVNVEWTCGGSRGSLLDGTGDTRSFEIVPNSGILQPNQRCNLEITFKPHDDRSYQAKIPFKIANNTKIRQLNFMGSADKLKVDTIKEVLELAPILPFTDESEPSTFKEFEITNPTSHDVEVYSLDFDQQYLDEDDTIRQVLAHQGSTRFHASLRIPGEGLQEELMNIYKSFQPKPDVEDCQVEVGELEVVATEIATSYRDRGLAYDFVLLGQISEYVVETIVERMESIDVCTLNDVIVHAAQEGKMPIEVCAHYSIGNVVPPKKGKQVTLPLTVEVLSEVIRWKLSQSGNGIVLSDLNSEIALKDLTLEDIATSVKNSIDTSTMKTIWLDNGDDAFEKVATILVPEFEVKTADEVFESKDEPKEVEELEIDIPNQSDRILRIKDIENAVEITSSWLPHLGTPVPEPIDPYFLAMPSDKVYHVIGIPSQRPTLKETITKFRLQTVVEGEETDDDAEYNRRVNATRWVIKAGEAIKLQVLFKSSQVGTFEQQLTFNIVGGQRPTWMVARGVCTVPMVSTDPRNVFMNRIKSRPPTRFVSKKYVMGFDCFEFGPLLLGVEPSEKNSERFRISNSGVLAVSKVSFAFILESDDGDIAEISDPSILPFTVEPSELIDLEVGETRDIVVAALPVAKGEFRAKLVCTILDNPDACGFNITCIGSEPTLLLEGPWMDNASVESEPCIDFERLLLGRYEEKRFTITNTCEVALKWSIAEPQEAFTFSVFEGVIAPFAKADINVGFTAKEPQKVDQSIEIVFSDAEDAGSSRMSKLRLKAEAYSIQIQPSFLQEETGAVNLGTLRVFEVGSKEISLTNSGIYPVEYCFENSKNRTKDILRVEPATGVLDPSEKALVTITFQSDKETSLRFNKDIKCNILEPQTGEVVETFEVPVNATSVFSSVRIQPMKGLHFGALQYGSTPTKTFEIRNDGVFAFSFEVISSSQLKERRQQLEVSRSDHTDEVESFQNMMLRKIACPKQEGLQVNQVEFGNFVMVPGGGLVAPGESVSVQVTFNATEEQACVEQLHVVVSGSCPDEQLISGYPFELAGESHIPGISTDTFQSIFEEQSIARSNDLSLPGVFSTSERVFSYGHLIPSSLPANGVCQRFKISNPNKIKAVVNCSIEARSLISENVFSVQPAQLELPAHEYEFVSVYFKPAAMANYVSKFKAQVVDGKDSQTNLLEFDLQGEGTLPCITVVSPASLSTDAKYDVHFGKLQVGRKSEQTITIRNDGIVPVTVRFDMTIHGAFSTPLRNSSITLQTTQVGSIPVSFSPMEPGDQAATLLMRVLHNEFELFTFELNGSGFQEDISFDELNDDMTLQFGDLPLLGELAEKTTNFSLKNNCNHVIRFEWKNDQTPQVCFNPSAGHIAPYGSIPVLASLSSQEPISLNASPVNVVIQKISYTEEAYEAAAGKTIEWTSDSEVEPSFIQDSTSRDILLPCFAEVDTVAYSVESRDVHFKPTMMFQSRAFKLPVMNPGRTSLVLDWNIAPEEGNTTNQRPFSITPASTIIAPDSEETFTIRFAPTETDIGAFIAQAAIQNGDDSLKLKLSGVAQRPVCHLEMEPSTYLERRGGLLPDLTELGFRDASEIRVLEFESLGTKVKNTKRFSVVNPMNIPYEFHLSQVTGVPTAFKCNSTRGLILPGKRYDVAISFTPEDTDIHEACWRFEIPEQHVSLELLLVGSVLEPRVELEKSHINFHSVLIDGKSEERLMMVNHECIPFAFSFDPGSFVDQVNDFEGADGKKQRVLAVEPMTGTIGANGTFPLIITFAPQTEKSHNFNLKCQIHRKPGLLSLNVKGEGSAIHDQVVLVPTEKGDFQHPMILKHGDKTSNEISFGQVHINDSGTRTIQIHNRGKFNFDFVWSNTGEAKSVSLIPMKGTVPCGQSTTCVFKFSPHEETFLDNLVFRCVVAGARNYKVCISGVGTKPPVTFSCTKLDFGPCFMVERGSTCRAEEKIFTITNSGSENDISLDCLHEKTEALNVTFERVILKPGMQVQVPVKFTPREIRTYNGIIPFEINGIYPVNIYFAGEGTPMNLVLEEPEDSNVSFGSLRVGQRVTKTVRIVNRSKRAVSFLLTDKDNALSSESVSFTRCSNVASVLRPRESCEIELTFAPQHRISHFSAQVHMEVNGEEKQLLVVSGSCQAMDVKLELSNMNFAPVSESCRITRKLQVHNAGDLGAKFRWESPSKENFSIFPMDGYLPAYAQLMVDVTFHPTHIAQEIIGEAVLIVEGNETPLFPLSLSGSCTPQPEGGVQELSFQCTVRTEQSKLIQIQNTTKQPWSLEPVIKNLFWTGKHRVDIAAGATVDYELIFAPLAMTLNDAPSHEGTVFFALPNGTSLLYRLIGTAGEPQEEATITEESPSKKRLIVPIPVQNWIRNAIHLQVTIEKLEGTDDHFYNGARTMEIPASSLREYKLTFIGHIVGYSKAKVTFTDSSSGEYMLFIINMKCTEPEPISELALQSSVRHSTCKRISLENPFYGSQTKVMFENSWWECDHPCIKVKLLNNISESREGVFEVEYRPLLSGESLVTKLTLKSPQLGTYPYNLQLSSTSAVSDRSIQFHTTLGSTHEQVFRFTNYCSKATQYTCKVSQPLFFNIQSPSIKLEAVSAWGGTEVAVKVSFEPQALGEVKDMLVLSSSDGGEYTCSLYGKCDPPRPQGPFVIHDAAKGVSIEFKNIFDQPKEFRFLVDNTNFSVNGAQYQQVKIDAGKTTSVIVKGNGKTSTGKLLVSCVDLVELPPWTFYMKQ